MTDGPGNSRLGREAVQIFFVSLALMMFETNMVRIFSVVMYFHLVFFVLAIALFGIGLGGLYAQFARRRLSGPESVPGFVNILPTLLALSFLVALAALLSLPFNEAMHSHHVPRLRWLFAAFLIAALPFFLGSLFISLIFAARPQNANRLYFSDLIGAAMGSFLAVPALQWLGGTTAPCLIALLALAPNMFLAPSRSKLGRIAAVAVIALAIIFGAANYKWDLLSRRSLSLIQSDAKPTFTKWNFYVRIAVQDDPYFRGWWLSRQYDGPIPEHAILTQDGRAPTYITRFDGDFDKVQYLLSDISAMPHKIVQPERAMIIGSGGGRDILTAKMLGVDFVRGVELNPITANDVMRDAFKEYSGNVYGLDGVDIVVENGRTFVKRDQEAYDLVYSSLADTQLGSAQGAFVLSENHLYTVEAFEAYWDRLTENGVYANVGGAYMELYDIFLRLIITHVTALEKLGVPNPQDHIMVVVTDTDKASSFVGHTILVGRQPINAEMLARAKAACNELGFHVAWPPTEPDNRWTQRLTRVMDPEQREQLFAANKYDLRPLYDDRPYIFYNTKPANFLGSLFHPNRAKAEGADPKEFAFYLIINLFLVALGSVIVLMLTPLLLFRRGDLRGRGVGALAFLAFFFMLGVAYILVEVSLLQQLFLFLGNPTLTFAVSLGVMLAFTGLGSLYAKRFPYEKLRARIAQVAVVAVIAQLCVWSALPRLIETAQGLPMPSKLGLVVGILAIVATPMGMLFPSGIRLAGRSGLDLTCWVWGMNGVGSVLGSVGSTIVSMNLGIRTTFLVGVLCYVLALVISRLFRADAVAES